MIANALVSPVSTPSPYARWYRHFQRNHHASANVPWDQSPNLSAEERRLVAPSIQQFHLGEWARGRGFSRRAAAHRRLASDDFFLPALQLFIAEEQEHSGLLGRFLDREQIPRLRQHWLDETFRWLRKLAGLELCATVLVTAETLAIPFYQALRDATRSPLLRAICVRILCDEAAHLKFQALTIGLIRRSLGKRARNLRRLGHAALFYGTALLLWQQHRPVFRAATWNFRRFWSEARREFAILERHVRQVTGSGTTIAEDRCLD